MQTILYKRQDLENIQGSMAKDGKYSIDDLNGLITSISKATKLDENEISLSVGRNAGYISQCRSRGKVSDNFIEVLNMKYKNELEGLKNQPVFQNGGIDPKDYIQALKDQIQLLRDQLKSKDKDKAIDINLDSLRSELLTRLEANRIFLKEMYLLLKEQQSKHLNQVEQEAQRQKLKKGNDSLGEDQNKGKPKDGHSKDISKTDK